MDVFSLQASLTLNKKEYEKALADAETQAKQFSSKLESTVNSAMQNAGKSFGKGFDTSGFVNMTKVTTEYYNHVIKAAENASKAKIAADAQVEKTRLASNARIEASENAYNARIEAARIAAEQRANAEAEKLAEKHYQFVVKWAERENKERQKQIDKIAKEAEKALEKKKKEEEKALAEKIKLIQKQQQEEEKAIADANKGTQRAIAEVAKMEERHNAEIVQNTKDTWNTVTSVIQKQIEITSKVFSVLGNAADSVFSFVYETAKAVFQKVLDVGESAFSGISDFVNGAFEKITDIIGDATSALINFGKEAVNVGMEFEHSMSKVSSILETTSEELANVNVSANLSFGDFSGNLQELALSLGEHTKYTPDQVAQTIAVAVQNGMKEQEVADFSELFLAAASAGDIDPATASNYIIKNKNALQLSAEQAREMTDMMAVASANSGSTFSTLGQGMMKIGSMARNLKGGAAEEIEILALLSNAGENLTGTMGGNALRNIIKNLQNARSDAAAAAFEQMGFSAYDENDKMRPLPDIIADFRNYFKDKIDISNGENMEQDKLYSEIMNKIFTAYSITGMSALIATPEEKFTDLQERLANADGAAVRMAEERENNLQGDVTRFDSALLVIKTRIAEELTPSLRDFVQFATSELNLLNDAVREDGVSGGFEMLATVATDSLSKISSSLPNIVNNIEKSSKAFLNGIRKNTKDFSNGFSKAVKEIAKLSVSVIPDFIEDGMQIAIALMDGFTKAVPDIVRYIPEFISNITDAVTRNSSQLRTSGKNLIDSLFTSISQNKEQFKTAFSGFYNNVVAPAFNDMFVGLPDFFTNILSQTDLSGVGSVIGSLFERLDISGAVESGKNLFRAVIHKGLEAVTQNTDNANITQSIADIFTNGIENLSGIKIDGSKIAHGFNAVIQAVDFQSLGGSINTVINNFLDTTNELLDNIDWESAGSGIGTVINGIDFGGISHKIFTALAKTIENSDELLDGVASAIDAQTANSLLSMAGTLAMGEAVLLAIAVNIAKNAPAIILATGKLSIALATTVKTALGSEVVLGAATAGGVGIGTAIGAGVVSAVAGWQIGTVIRESILGSDAVDDAVEKIIDDVKDAGYQIKAVWNWLFDNPEGLTSEQIYKNIALDATASGAGFQSDTYKQMVYDWGQDLSKNFGKGASDSTDIENAIQDKLDWIHRNMGFSVPEEGVLSDFDTYAPDMMQLFAKGINENAYLVENEISGIGEIIRSGFQEIAENAFSWGSDVTGNFISGIDSGFSGSSPTAKSSFSTGSAFSAPVVVQNLTITLPEWNISSPSDMRELANALTDQLVINLNARAIYDNRSGGGIGWQMN